MSTTTAPSSTPSARTGLRLTGLRVARAEVLKLRTTRSTWVMALLSVLCLVGLSALVSSRADSSTDVLTSALSGSTFVAIVFGAFGAVTGAREFGTGLIRTSLAAVPKRGGLVGAKLVALLVVVVPVALVGVLGATVLGSALAASKGATAVVLSDSTTLATIGAHTAYLAGSAVIGLGLGLILKSSAGAVASTIGVFLVLPLIVSLALPAEWSEVDHYLPSAAGGSMTSIGQTTDGLSPATGAAVFALWALASVLGAVVAMKRRDA